MTFTDLVRTRRSVRRYKPDDVAPALLDTCLEAARLAPSACNSQPWLFHVVQGTLKSDLARAMNSGLYGKGLNAFIDEAPLIVAVETLPRERLAPRLAGLIRNVRYEMLDVAIAVDHFTLQAAELGLGTCWIGWFNEKAVKEQLGLPPKSRIDVMLTLGWPDDRGAPKNRKPLGAIVRRHGTPSP
ncbi:MAG: nitroreductase family protein [Synergistaceae bacterium]|jgi:nitroreductase|nr:nitroreductase family protein [Synergistaceae bacterium]